MVGVELAVEESGLLIIVIVAQGVVTVGEGTDSFVELGQGNVRLLQQA